MERRIKLILGNLLLINSFVIFGCAEKIREVVLREKFPETVMLVSKEHQEYFPHLKEKYEDEEILNVLKEQQNLANPVCGMLYGYKPFDKKAVERLSKKLKLKLAVKKWYNYTVDRLIAGCWNFYQMNDLNTDKDFILLGKLYPNLEKECFSVGFIQPYLMHSILNCKKVTALDINWRIMEAHQQIHKLFRSRDLVDEDDIKDNLPKIEVRWSANMYDLPVEKFDKIDLSTFCKEEEVEICKKAILVFQKKAFDLENFNFQISKLHNGELKIDKNSTLVFYLSNAIDWEYTSTAQFQQLMKNSIEKIDEGKFALFIYHVGGASGFGIYEVYRENGKPKIVTRCKDVYSPPLILKDQKNLVTYFDKLTTSRGKLVTCSSLN
ncbi:MAG: hypothetical protein SFU98_11195 [Leptospiraceae bacterium]|nr:hypothetical protein [Leptospiraceae bacterium]